MTTERQVARMKKATIIIKKEWEPVDPNNPEDVAMAKMFSEDIVWELNPKQISISQKRDVNTVRDAGSEKTVEMDVGPTTVTVSGELLD